MLLGYDDSICGFMRVVVRGLVETNINTRAIRKIKGREGKILGCWFAFCWDMHACSSASTSKKPIAHAKHVKYTRLCSAISRQRRDKSWRQESS